MVKEASIQLKSEKQGESAKFLVINFADFLDFFISKYMHLFFLFI